MSFFFYLFLFFWIPSAFLCRIMTIFPWLRVWISLPRVQIIGIFIICYLVFGFSSSSIAYQLLFLFSASYSQDNSKNISIYSESMRFSLAYWYRNLYPQSRPKCHFVPSSWSIQLSSLFTWWFLLVICTCFFCESAFRSFRGGAGFHLSSGFLSLRGCGMRPWIGRVRSTLFFCRICGELKNFLSCRWVIFTTGCGWQVFYLWQ